MGAIFLIGCGFVEKAYEREWQQREAERKKQWESLKVEDGISLIEAHFIASEYFDRYVSGCGTLGGYSEDPEFWKFEVILGFAARRYEHPLMINKKNGQISLEGFPTISDPFKIDELESIEQFTTSCPDDLL